MKVTMEKKKVYAFIDSQNLNLGVRSQGWKLDFSKFRQYLHDKYKGDFHCLIEYLEQKGKLLYVLTPNKHDSSLLRKFSSYIVRVDWLRNSLEFKKTGISGRSETLGLSSHRDKVSIAKKRRKAR